VLVSAEIKNKEILWQLSLRVEMPFDMLVMNAMKANEEVIMAAVIKDGAALGLFHISIFE